MRGLMIVYATLTVLQVLEVFMEESPSNNEDEAKIEDNKTESMHQLLQNNDILLLTYGKNVLSDVIDHLKQFGISTFKLGGTLANTPLKIGTNTLDVINHIVRVPSKVSDRISSTVTKVLSKEENDDHEQKKSKNQHVKDHTVKENQSTDEP